MKFLITSIYMFGLLTVYAQDGNVVSGGNLSGSDGSVTYSVGQFMYSSGTNSVNSSIQKPFEADVLQSVDEIEETLEVSTFPNPSTGQFVLTIEDLILDDLEYQVLDILGNVVDQGDLNNEETSIDISHLPASNYVLNIIYKDKEVKNLKLIKQ